jgi:filamentous hemagglutinin family protein
MARTNRGRGESGVRVAGLARQGRAALLRSTALQAAALLVLALPTAARAQPAPNARPTGGTVVAGQASITAQATNTRIDQNSQRAAIDWRSFDVGRQQSVQFRQPSTSAVVLNRVTGPDPSQIAGRLTANGQVVIVNQSGVTFSKGAQVETAWLVVSAAGISNANFMSGGTLVFDQAPKPNATVRNDGAISVGARGLAALVAPTVANSGTITARMGHVVLAGAAAHTVDLYGDGLLSINVTKQVQTLPVGPDGKPVAALVTNTGAVRADGGTVVLTAQAVDGLVQTLVSAGGTVRADSVGAQTGTVVVSGIGGAVRVDGRIAAAGRAAGTTGGGVEVNATGAVEIGATARIDASGRAGGGAVAIGTTLARARGGPGVTPALTASAAHVAAGARIRADAVRAGAGGSVAVLSTGDTAMAGTISARGGRTGGDGGRVEVSGGGGFALTGSIDVSAAKGAAGTILIDPRDLSIVASGGTITTPNAGTPNVPAGAFPDAATDATIDVGTIAGLSGNIVLQATRDLMVAAPLTVTLTGGGTYFELDAGRAIAVNAALGSTNADIVLRSGTAGPGGGITLAANVSAPGANTVSLIGDSLTLGSNTVSAGTVEVAPATMIGMTLGGTSAGTLSLPSLTGLNATTTLRLGATTDPAAHTLATTATAIAIAGPVTAAAPTLDLRTGGAVTQMATGVLTANTLTGAAASVALATVPNMITTLGAFTTGGNFALTNGQGLTTNGAVMTGTALGTTLNLTTTAGDLTIGAGVSAPSVTLQAFGSLSIGGAVAAAGTNAVSVTLVAQNGDVGETAAGTVAAPLLTGSAHKGTSATATGRALLTNTAAGGNQVTALGAFATDGDFALTNGTALDVTGAVNAGAGGIALKTAAGTGLTLGAALTATGVGQTISLIADTLTIGAGGAATAGAAIEIAPVSSIGVTLGTGGAGLNIDPATIGVLSAPLLRIGRAQGATTASAIAITTATTSPAATLELDTTGGITQSAALSAGTLTGNAITDVVLNLSGNTLPVLGAFTVTGGNFTLATQGDLSIAGALAANAGTVSLSTPNGDITETAAGTVAAATLTVSAHKGTSATATGRAIFDNTLGAGNQIGTLGTVVTDGDFTLLNAAPLTVSGPVAAGTPVPAGPGAPATQGAVVIAAQGALTLAGDITARHTGAGPGITLAAQGAAGDVIQTAGTVATDGTLMLTAGRNVTLSGGVLTSGGGITVTGVDVTQGGQTISSFGNILVTGTTITQNAGGVIAGTMGVALDAPSVVQNAGGVIAAQGTASIAPAGALTIDGTLYLPSGSTAIGSTSFDIAIGGTILGGSSFSPASSTPWPGAITVSGGAAPGTLTVRGDYIYLSGALTATAHLTLIATHDIFEHARGSNALTGTITTALLSGSAGTLSTLGSALLAGANAIDDLGTFTATRSLTVNDTGALMVTGTVTVGTAGASVAGDPRVFPPSGPGTLADEVAAQAGTGASVSPRLELDASALTVAASESLTADSTVVGGTVTPGVVAVRTDSLVLAGTITALDGTVAIAPLTPGGTISLGSGTGLVLTQAMLGRIATLGVSAGTAGTQTLALGSVDGGTTQLAGAITIASGIDLSAIAHTLQVDALGDVTATPAGSLTLAALTGHVGGTVSLGGGTFASGAVPSTTNAIGMLGVAARARTGGTIYQTLAGSPFALTGLSAGGDVAVLDSGTLSVVGTIAAGAGRTVALTAPTIVVDATSLATNGIADNAGLISVAAGFAAPVGGVVAVTPGTVALRTGALTLTGAGPEILAPDGTVAIAPYIPGTAISLGSGASTGLALTQATISGISTLGVAGGIAGTATLALGSLDGGAHTLASAVTVVGAADLSLVAATLQASATGGVTSTTADSLIVGALTGQAGGDVSIGGGLYADGMIPATGNRVGRLGAATRGATYQLATGYGLATTALTAGGDVRVTDTIPLSVVGAVTAGAGRTIALTVPALTVDASGFNAGSLSVQSAFGAPSTLTVAGGTATGIVITPGTIALQTDQLTATGAIAAPDGTVAIAPYTAGTAISIGTNATTGLALTQATLAEITTLGVSGGIAGTETLALGSLDGGAHALASTITVAGVENLMAVANTLQVAATGDVTATPADVLRVAALTGRVGGTVSLGGGPFPTVLLPATGNAIGALGAARTAVGTGAVYQAAAGSPFALTGLSAGGDVAVLDSGTLSVVGTVAAGAGRTVALTAPTIIVDATSLATNGIADNAGLISVAAGFGAPVGGVVAVTPGTVALRTGALTLTGAGPEILAPDGTVAIAPYIPGTAISLGSGASTGLALTQATISGISTLGVAGGIAGTATLALGSLDGGAHALASAVTVVGTADLSLVAATLQANATGGVTSTTADSLIVGALTGQAGGDVSIGGGLYADGMIPVTGNRVGRLGAATRGATYQLATGYGLATTALTARGDVRVTNTIPLAVVGAVTAGAGHTIALTVPALTVDASGFNAGSLSVASVRTAQGGGASTVTPGTIALQTDSLGATGAIAAPDGTVEIAPYTLAGTISLGAGSGLVLTQGVLNEIATLGSSTGPVGTQTLALGSLDGGAHLLATGGILVNASVDLTTVAQTLSLFTAGAVTEASTAGITVSALTGNAASMTLPGPNVIAFIGTPRTIGTDTTDPAAPGAPNLDAGAFTLNSIAPSLTVRTVLTVNNAASLTDSGDLLVPGTIHAGSVTLAAGHRITESGTLITGGLSATAGYAIDLRGATGANRIGSLTGLSSNTAGTADTVLPGFGAVVRDYQALSVTGAASDGGGTASGISLVVASGPANLAINAPVSAGGTVKLQATGGISGGGISAGTLIAQAGVVPDTEAGGATPGTAPTGGQVTATAAIALTTPNAVQTLGPTSATGSVAIYDGGAVGTLTVAGPVLAGSAGATATADIEATNNMSVTGSVQGSSVTLLAGTDAASGNAASGALNVAGTVSGGTVTLGEGASRSLSAVPAAIGNGVTIGGTVTGSSVAIFAGGRIVEPGTINAGTLTGTAGYAIDLRGTAGANAIGTLAGLTGNAAGTPDQAVPGFGTVVRTSGALRVAGPVQDLGGAGAGVSLIVAGAPADLTLAGTVSGGAVMLQSSGTITEVTGGRIAAGTLTGSATGDATLGNDNAVGALGGFSTTGGLTLLDRGSLAVNGALVAGTAVRLTLPDAAGSLTVNGTITAPLVALAAGGSIAETGTIATARLTANAGGSASFTGANQIAALGPAAAGTSLQLTDGPSLTIDNTLSAGTDATVTVTGGSLTVSGALTAGRTAALSATGAITETGSLTVATLTGSAGGSASFNGASPTANAIGTLGPFTAGGPLTVRDGTSLAVTGSVASAAPGTLAAPSVALSVAGGGSLVEQAGATIRASDPQGVVALATNGGAIGIDGTLAAPLLLVSAPGGTVTLGNGSAIVTGTKTPPRPIGNATNGQPFPTPATSQGAFLTATNLTQTGLTTVNGGPANGNGRIDATVRIDLDSPNGKIQFNNLQASTTQLYLVLDGGSASGGVTVGGLNVNSGVTSSSAPGAGSVSLSGTVAGRGGTAAAGVSYLDPQRNSRFSINNCALQSVNCVLLSPLIVPVTNPTQDISLGTDRRRRDDSDLILPNVGEQDF